MGSTYKYDHALPRHIMRHIVMILGVSIIVAGGGIGFFVWQHHKLAPTHMNGAAVLVPQTSNQQAFLQVTQPLFTMQLPSDWKQTGEQDIPTVHSVSWQATTKNADNRFLTIYIDTIPATMPVNRELPLTAHGNQISYGPLSDNCANFTPGGTLDTGQAEKLKPAPSVWQGVNFICNLPDVVNNQIGTGSMSGVNSVTVTGPTGGTHRYFFLYTDLNINPDYTILYDAVQSFRAK